MEKNIQDHTHSHFKPHNSVKNLRLAFILNFVFALLEIAGALYTNSVAILSDAIHDLGDSLILGTSLYLEKYSQKGRNAEQTYGYKRFSLLGALISSLVLIAGSVFILFHAIPRLLNPETVDAKGMLALSILGIVVNLAAVWRLKGGSKLNEKVVFLHLLEDVLGWVAVFAVSLILLFYSFPILDPILSIVITLFILVKATPILKNTIKIFLQYAPKNINVSDIRNLALEDKEIADIQDMHVWSLDGEYNIFSARVLLVSNLSLVEIVVVKQKLISMLNKQGINHATIEFEPQAHLVKECDL